MKAQIYGYVDKPWGSAILDIVPSTITFENQHDIQATLEKLFSCKFRLSSNGRIEADGTFLSGMTVLEYYKIHHPEIPSQDIVVVPHAFYGSYRNQKLIGAIAAPYDDDIPLEPKEGETAVSVWIKEHPAPELKKEKKVTKLYRCPACGDVLTEEEYVKSLGMGSNGYCSCRFSAKDKQGNIWFPREYTEYEVFTREVK